MRWAGRCPVWFSITHLAEYHDSEPVAKAWELFLSGVLNEHEKYLVQKHFYDEDFLASRCFTLLHKVVLGLAPGQSLSSILGITTRDINAVDAYQRTCLTWAAIRSDETSLQILLDFGALPDIRDSQGRTALHHVRGVKCCQLLLDRGADAKARDFSGRTILHWAGREIGDEGVINEVLSNVPLEADFVDLRDDYGETAIQNAAYNNKPGCVEALLNNGADPLVGHGHGKTAIHFAILSNAHGALESLLSWSGDISSMAQRHGKSFVEFVAESADCETMRMLGRNQKLLESGVLEYSPGSSRDDQHEDAMSLLDSRVEDLESLRIAFQDLMSSVDMEQVSLDDDDPNNDVVYADAREELPA